MAKRRQIAVVDVDVVEHEATAVGVHDEAREGVGRREEAAAHAVRVDVLDRGDVLAGQAQVGLPGLLAVGGEVEARAHRGRGRRRPSTAARTSGYISAT